MFCYILYTIENLKHACFEKNLIFPSLQPPVHWYDGYEVQNIADIGRNAVKVPIWCQRSTRPVTLLITAWFTNQRHILCASIISEQCSHRGIYSSSKTFFIVYRNYLQCKYFHPLLPQHLPKYDLLQNFYLCLIYEDLSD